MSETKTSAPSAPKPVIEQVPVETDFAQDTTATEETAQAEQVVSNQGKRAKKTKAPVADPSATAGRFQDATVGFFQGVGQMAWAYADKHPHAVLYGLIGLVLAILILVIGLWDTIVIAVFVIVGAVIGQMVDGDNAIVNFFSRLFDRRR